MQTRTADLYRVKVRRSIIYSRHSSVFIELQSDELDSIWTRRPRVCGFGLRLDSKVSPAGSGGREGAQAAGSRVVI